MNRFHRRTSCVLNVEQLEDRRLLSTSDGIFTGTANRDYFRLEQGTAGPVKVTLWSNWTSSTPPTSSDPHTGGTVTAGNAFLDGAGGDDVFEIRGGIDPMFPIVIDGNSGLGDEIRVGRNSPYTWTLQGGDNNKLGPNLNLTFRHVENLVGSPDGDTFLIMPSAGSDVLSIDAGRGGTLDYSNWTAGVYVSLKDAIARAGSGNWTVRNVRKVIGGAGNDTLYGDGSDNVLRGRGGDDLLDGGPGNDDLGGGLGNDVLVGGLGNDNLMGDAGNDIVIGGTGADWLEGGGDSDFLIDGTTTYDQTFTDPAALRALSATWSNTALTKQQRLNALAAGVTYYWYLNGRPITLHAALTPSTMFHDSSVDDFIQENDANDYWWFDPSYAIFNEATGQLEWHYGDEEAWLLA